MLMKNFKANNYGDGGGGGDGCCTTFSYLFKWKKKMINGEFHRENVEIDTLA